MLGARDLWRSALLRISFLTTLRDFLTDCPRATSRKGKKKGIRKGNALMPSPTLQGHERLTPGHKEEEKEEAKDR